MVEPQLVALHVPPGPQLAHAVKQVWAGGDAVLPLDPRLPRAALDQVLRELRPTVVADATSRIRLPDPEPVGDGVALVVATSGSSGPAKGVELTHGALRHAAAAAHERLGLEVGDRWLACLPAHHVAGFSILVRSALLGTEPVFLPEFDPDLVDRARQATVVALVPTMLERMLAAGADVARFRRVLLGGAPAPVSLLERAAAAGATVVTSYGMTETAGGCVYDGRPLRGVGVTLGADSRVLVRGPVVMRGYRLRPDLTAAALSGGWFRTADRGMWDPDGRLVVTGRIDATIITGGENVDPEAVAAVLREHPAVTDAAVFGVPDREWGERVVACCVPADPGRPLDLAALREFAGGRLARHQLPTRLHVVAGLPRTPLGKVAVDRLRQQLVDAPG